MTTTQELVATHLPSISVNFDFVLAPLTYFKIGGPAEVYIQSNSIAEVKSIVKFCHEFEVPLTMLGGASNVIVADDGIVGVVLHLQLNEFTVTEVPTVIRVGAGEKTSLCVGKSNNHGLTGLEYFLGVPGTVGGAVYNNAHYLQHLIANHISQVRVLDRAGNEQWLSVEECRFTYDHSRFQETKEIVLEVEFTLQPGDINTSRQLIKEATEYRARTQPLGEPSSGCIFQNAPNTPDLQALFPQFADKTHISGGFLIDQAGMKGEKIGNIEVSHKHAAFFVNHGGGTARDVALLVKKVKDKVAEKFGVVLEEEVFYLK
ncbi:MAG: UDP-N-acetylmuramate dehydrogenase [bacterium]|nr:UDP-N-acetylmuramate dehydrogenase [bacterium]